MRCDRLRQLSKGFEAKLCLPAAAMYQRDNRMRTRQRWEIEITELAGMGAISISAAGRNQGQPPICFNRKQ